MLPDPIAAIRAAAATTTFLLKVLPMLPSGLIDRLTSAPVVERVGYPTRAGPVEADLYRPSSRGRHPGVVICLGVVPFEFDHPQVPVLGRAFARAGFAALLHWSPAMRSFRLEPEDVEDIAGAYRSLIERPDVDPGRSGLVGTCVGGSFALMAAASPLIRDRVAFVAEWAAYSSMWTFAQDIASATRPNGRSREPWSVDLLTRKVYVQSMTAVLPAAEAERLRCAFAERSGHVDEGTLSAEGRAIRPLLGTLDADEAERALRRLPAAMQHRLDALSPVEYLNDVAAPLIVMAHDRDDTVIPLDESRRLWSVLRERPGARYTEFGMFQHMDPSRQRVSLPVMIRELLRFLLFVYPVFRQAARVR